MEFFRGTRLWHQGFLEGVLSGDQEPWILSFQQFPSKNKEPTICEILAKSPHWEYVSLSAKWKPVLQKAEKDLDYFGEQSQNPTEAGWNNESKKLTR